MEDDERNDDATSVETASLEDVLAVFNDVRGPVITGADVEDQFDCTTEAAHDLLERLYDQGEVGKRNTGPVIVWWPTEGPSQATSEQMPVSGEIQGDIETSLDDNLPGEHIGEDVE